MHNIIILLFKINIHTATLVSWYRSTSYRICIRTVNTVIHRQESYKGITSDIFSHVSGFPN